MLHCRLVTASFSCSLVANLPNQPVFIALDFQLARVKKLCGVLLYVVIVGSEAFEDDDEVGREVGDFGVEQPLGLDFALESQVVLHEVLDVDLVLNFVEDATLLEFQLDDRELLLL